MRGSFPHRLSVSRIYKNHTVIPDFEFATRVSSHDIDIFTAKAIEFDFLNYAGLDFVHINVHERNHLALSDPRHTCTYFNFENE